MLLLVKYNLYFSDIVLTEGISNHETDINANEITVLDGLQAFNRSTPSAEYWSFSDYSSRHFFRL